MRAWFVAVVACCGLANAEEASSTRFVELTVYPPHVELHRGDEGQTLVAVAKQADGLTIDVTDLASWRVATEGDETEPRVTLEGDNAPTLKRFYERAEAVAVDGVYAIQLDRRTAKTPKRKPLATRHDMLARAVADEWAQAGDVIDTNAMPLTKLLSTVIDLGPEEKSAWRELVLSYLQSDLLCYRASEPAALATRQKAIWDPYLTQWAADFGTPLKTVDGLMATPQPGEAIEAAGGFLDTLSMEHLLAVKGATEITGSAVLAISLGKGAGEADAIFDASRLDEHFQQERWGVDAEAKEREEAIRRDFDAIVQFLALTT